MGDIIRFGGIGIRISSDLLLTYLHSQASQPWAQRIAQINHFVELSKPDSLLVSFRNAIIATKNLGLEESFPKNAQMGKPKALLIFGSGHWGIPEYIKAGKQTLVDYLALYPRPFINHFFGKNNPHLYTSVIITPANNDFNVEKIEDQDLKKIFG